ncbi:various chains-domain-containing protein [Scheffersomyces coipomensis]|uniref:various chains-domain-containing protein n=1 Tax=Scheffersomyces coipomensis TaxID=1788519 RepID=UPI00315DDF81
MSIISVIVGLYNVSIQLENGENEEVELHVTPDYLESNLLRDERSSDLELILNKPANYHTFNEYDLKSPYLALIVLANLIGLILLPLVNDLLVLYVIIELQSYSLYLLTGLHNRSYNASKASLLYFLMGGVASAIILLASYFIYSLTGSTNLSDIAIFYSFDNSFDYFDILLIALLFKMGMAPLHPYISIVAKISILSFIFINANLFSHNLIIVFFYISLSIAAYKPLFQVNIKTILAYSGLLNFGYLLLTIVTYDISFYIYIIQYVLTHLILFLGLLAAILSLILAFFSLIGIPPLPGFYGKLYVIISALQDNYVLETCIIIIFSVISTYYYANIIKILITSLAPSATPTADKVSAFINPSLAYSIALSTILLISFFIFLPLISEGSAFSVSFILVAILFLPFDLEISSILPYVVSAYSNNIYGLSILIIFLFTLVIAFIFEINLEALKLERRFIPIIKPLINKLYI